MKKINYLLALLIILSISSCTNTNIKTSIFTFSSQFSTSTGEVSSSSTTSNEPSSSNSSTKENSTSSSESSFSSSSSSSAPSSSSSSSASSSESKKEDESDVILPIGNKKLDGPTNEEVNIEEWVNYEVDNEIPTGFRHIYGNNFSSPSFYRENGNNYAIKFDQLYKGIQSPKLTPFKKIEVRLLINPITNNSQSAKSQKNEVLHIYGYDKEEALISTSYIEQGTITKQKENSEIKFYLKNIDISYFEIRLNAFPYKGSQCYNFGINKISIKGWPYD